MTGPPGSADGAQDPSMEEILASIRRILSEDETAAEAEPAAPPHAAPAPPPPSYAGAAEPIAGGHAAMADDILDLDPGMLVAPPSAAPPPLPSPPPPAEVVQAQAAEPLEIHPEPAAEPALPDAFEAAPPPPDTVSPAYSAGPTLTAPEAVAAAAQSLSGLMRTLTAERATAVHRGGPTIEDLVREEIRPLLKDWLDTHLAPLVERLVRTEIERVVTRTQL